MKFAKVEPYGGYEKKLSTNWKTFWGQCKPLENVTTQEHSMVFPIHFLISIYHDQIGKFILAKSTSKQRDSQNERQIKCQQIKWENVWILLSSQSPWQINKFLIDDPLCIGQCPFNMEIILRIKKKQPNFYSLETINVVFDQWFIGNKSYRLQNWIFNACDIWKTKINSTKMKLESLKRMMTHFALSIWMEIIIIRYSVCKYSFSLSAKTKRKRVSEHDSHIFHTEKLRKFWRLSWIDVNWMVL